MRRLLVAASAATFAFTSPALAQVCVGFPTGTGQYAVALASTALTGGDRWGFEANANLANSFSVFGTLGVSDPELESADNLTYAGLGGAFFAGQITEALNQAIVGCPTVSIAFADIGDTQFYSVPVGFGVGTSLSLGEGNNQVHPYAIPSIVFSHSDADSATDFQFSLGSTVTFGGGFYVGGSVNRVFVEGADSEFAARAGFVF